VLRVLKRVVHAREGPDAVAASGRALVLVQLEGDGGARVVAAPRVAVLEGVQLGLAVVVDAHRCVAAPRQEAALVDVELLQPGVCAAVQRRRLVRLTARLRERCEARW